MGASTVASADSTTLSTAKTTLSTSSGSPAAAAKPSLVDDPAAYVDPLIGTGRGGASVGEINNFPGPAAPFGMMQFSPDTAGSYAGYQYHSDKIRGFSLDHASVGCTTFGDVPILPVTGDVGPAPWDRTESFSHDDEKAEPGYYAVTLGDSKVRAELAATTRTGLAQFTFPEGADAAQVLVKGGASLSGNKRADLRVVGDRQVTGSATTGNFCGKGNEYTVHYAITFDRPFTAHGTWDGKTVSKDSDTVDAPKAGAYLTFGTADSRTVRAKVSMSYVSVDGAEANMAAEVPGWSLDALHRQTRDQWAATLGTIRVAGRDTGELKTFYTALYHSLMHPNTFNDADGRYTGFDDKVRTLPAGHNQYANFSDWDTYRSLAPLQAMLWPKQASDMAQSLVNDAEQGGWWPRWPLANDYTGQMTGDNSVPLIANLYAFGARDFDLKKALKYLVKGATSVDDTPGAYKERPGIGEYVERGYMPNNDASRGDHQRVGGSVTLEWAIDDFAIAQLAKAMRRQGHRRDLHPPGPELAEHPQPRHRLPPAARRGRPLPGRPGLPAAAPGQVRPGRLRRGQRGAVQLARPAEHRRSHRGHGRARRGRRPPRHLLHEAERGSERALHVGGERGRLRCAVGVQPPGHAVEDAEGRARRGHHPVQPHARRRARQRRPRSPVLLVRVGRARPVSVDTRYPGSRRAQPALRARGPRSARQGKGAGHPRPAGVRRRPVRPRARARRPHLGAHLPPAVRGEGRGAPRLHAVRHAGQDLGDVPEGRATVVPLGRAFLPRGRDAQRGVGRPRRRRGEGHRPRSASGKPDKTLTVTTKAPEGLTVSPTGGPLGLDAKTGSGELTLSVKAAAYTAEGYYEIPVTVRGKGAADKPVQLSVFVLVAPEGGLAAAYDNTGSSDDADRGQGDYDGDGNTYSRQGLEAAGLKGGTRVEVAGTSFVWPAAPQGRPDNVAAAGQRIDLADRAKDAGKLLFVGSATHSDQRGSATVTFTDGSTATTDLSFGDWTLPGGGTDPVFGNTTVARTDHRNQSGGAGPAAYVFATKPYDVPEGKHIKSVTLPDNGNLHVFAVGLG